MHHFLIEQARFKSVTTGKYKINRMNALLELITYDHVHYNQLEQKTSRKKIEKLADKLAGIEHLIVQFPNCNINITRFDTVKTTGLNEDLADQIFILDACI